jgi:hypothetical protein
MEWLCGFVFVVALVAVVGHAIWVVAANILNAMAGRPAPREQRPPRAFWYCPACHAETEDRDEECQACGLFLDGQLARDLHRVRVAQREVRGLLDGAQIDRDTANEVLDQLETRARGLQGLPAKKTGARPRAKPVGPTAPQPASVLLAPADAVEVLPPESAGAPTPLSEPVATPAEPPGLFSPAVVVALSDAPAAPEPLSLPTPEPLPTPAATPPREPAEPLPPKRRLSDFLEEHNILWGELVGGLLIVGCSIALVVTLRQTLETIPYFRFWLSALVTGGLFGAGQYTLHRWKLAGTSRGMLVISLLHAPLTLLLLADPFTQGTTVAGDVAIKLGALVAFVGVVRTGGRDLIGTEHLPGPIDRRWLLSLGVVGAVATQLLSGTASNPWLPLLCFVVACGATLGGLSWYHPGRREEPISDKSGSALLMFVGLCAFALAAAWGLYLVRVPEEVLVRLHTLALPLVLAGVPVVEAGVLVLRRTTASGLRTLGTAVALAGFVVMTLGLALAWPNPLTVMLVAAATGAFLTRIAFRERLPWVQAGAIPLLALATVVGLHGAYGNWTVPADTSADDWLLIRLNSSASGVVLACFALLLGFVTDFLARRDSRQTIGYAIGALAVGAVGLLLVSGHGIDRPAPAVFAHVVLALGLLASNVRWKLRALAHGGLWVALAGSLWALWWQVPNQPAKWGFVVSLEALILAAGAVALRGTHGGATALLRRAGRDVAFAASVLSAALAALSITLRSEWHTGTLFALALTAVALARLTGAAAFTWAGSVAALLGLVHLSVYTQNGKPETLAVEIAILAHATLATLAAMACRRQARVFGDPLRWSARLSSALAVPLLFFPAIGLTVGLAFAFAALAVWLGALWLTFVLLWRERGAFSAFQAALSLAALLAAFAWIEQQPWWEATSLRLRDPRALHAFGLALAGMAVAWTVARRAVRAIPRARELWCDNPLSLDRLALATIVGAFLLLNVVAIVPGVRAELTPLGRAVPILAPPELAHAFDPAAWWLLALLLVAVLLSWRLSKFERDTDPHALGLAALLLTAPLVWAGTHAVDVAAASALRWGLALAFVAGSAALALRVPLHRVVEAGGFMMQPQPWLRHALLVTFAVAAGVVLVLSANVAEIGLSRLKPSGPDERSVFALMGAMASNLVPLALVVCGLATTAGRERSSGYALSGGLVFVATLTAGYALSVVTAGKPLDGTEQTRLFLVAAASAALWALAWLATERRVPGGVPLAVQVCLGFGALAIIALIPAGQLLVAPDEPLPGSVAPLGQFGWVVLALVSAAGFWHARRTLPAALPVVFAFAGLVAGVLVAAALHASDVPGWWLSFHALAIVWAAVGFAFLAALRRGGLVPGVVTVFAGLLVVCALRGGWEDPRLPWVPWVPAGLALSAAVLLGGIALRTRAPAFAAVSVLAVNLAAILVWVAAELDTLSTFLLTNAAGLSLATAFWTLVRIRQQRRDEGGEWLEVVVAAPLLTPALLLLGLVFTFNGAHTNPALAWGALAAVAIGCAVGLWDRAAPFARQGLYAVGVLAVLLGVVQVEPKPVWEVPFAAPALAAFVLGVAWFAQGFSRRTTPLFGMPERGDAWPWLVWAQSFAAAVVVCFGMNMGLNSPDVLHRLANPSSIAILTLAFMVLVPVYPEPMRELLRTTTVAFGFLLLTALAWWWPEPADPHVWLHRNAWLFVALTIGAVGGIEGAARVGTDWLTARRRVAGWATAIAFVVLCVNLIQQIPVYNPAPDVRRTPLTQLESLAMLAAIAGLFVLALRFALKPERDPFALPERGRTAYVYLAEVLLVLFFTQIRFNVPELFLGNVAKLWTFAVMVLAYVGIGLAEFFERKKLDVLALPLRRTGVLLPLIPLLAFWAKPPTFVSEFARDSAPGLGPLLGYLEKLPQHFDTYAWLWFLAGGVYGLVALSKKSFGWALLAALATNAAMWSLLAHNEVPFALHPQAWVIPLALIILVSEHVNRHRLTEDMSNAMRYGGIAMIYVASAADMFLAGVGSSMWLPVVLAVLCVAGVLVGILLRVRAFIYLGVAFLLLDLFSMIWYAAVDLQQTWVWYASGIVLGVVVLGLFAYLEKRRTHAKEQTESE